MQDDGQLRGRVRAAACFLGLAIASADAAETAAPRAPLQEAPAARDDPGEVEHDPIPAAPPGADPEKVLFATSVCAAAVLALPDGTLEVGCPSHPPFARPERNPAAEVPHYTGDPLRFCGIDAVYRGSFTRASAPQAVLAFSACKENPPHEDDWDSANPGSALLVEEVDGRWQAVGYQPDVNAGACVLDRRPDERDVLLCRSGLRASGARITYFFLLDFGRVGDATGTFAMVYDDLFLCGLLPPAASGQPLLPHGLASVKVTEFRVDDLDADGTGDLVATIERARAAPSPALDARAAATCKRDPDAHEQVLLPAPIRTRLEFLARGDAFVPTAATHRALDAWLAEEGDEAGLAAAAPPPLTE